MREPLGVIQTENPNITFEVYLCDEGHDFCHRDQKPLPLDEKDVG